MTINTYVVVKPNDTLEEPTSTSKHARIHEQRRERRHNVNNQMMKRRIHRTPVHRGLPEKNVNVQSGNKLEL